MDATLHQLLTDLYEKDRQVQLLRQELLNSPYYCDECNQLVFADHRSFHQPELATAGVETNGHVAYETAVDIKEN